VSHGPISVTAASKFDVPSSLESASGESASSGLATLCGNPKTDKSFIPSQFKLLFKFENYNRKINTLLLVAAAKALLAG
jgi:hypothetical protein